MQGVFRSHPNPGSKSPAPLTPKILRGVDRRVVDVNLIVQVRPRGLACHPHGPDGLAAFDLLANHHADAAQVAVLGGNPVAMVDQDSVTVPRVRAGWKTIPSAAAPPGAGGRRDVDPGVERTFTTQGVHALPESRRDLALHRPNRRDAVGVETGSATRPWTIESMGSVCGRRFHELEGVKRSMVARVQSRVALRRQG